MVKMAKVSRQELYPLRQAGSIVVVKLSKCLMVAFSPVGKFGGRKYSLGPSVNRVVSWPVEKFPMSMLA